MLLTWPAHIMAYRRWRRCFLGVSEQPSLHMMAARREEGVGGFCTGGWGVLPHAKTTAAVQL